jgi:hypothetical protein
LKRTFLTEFVAQLKQKLGNLLRLFCLGIAEITAFFSGTSFRVEINATAHNDSHESFDFVS